MVQIAYTRFHLIPLNILEEVLADIQADRQACFCMMCSFQAFYMVNIQDWTHKLQATLLILVAFDNYMY